MKLEREGAFLIAQIHQLGGRIFSGLLREHQLNEISPAQGRILFVLWQEDNISIQELAEKTSLSKSTLTIMLDRLEESGYIVRVPSRGDRRKILIRLTEKDRVLQDSYVEVSGEMIKICYAGFSSHQIDAFEKNLRRILGNLKACEKNMKDTA